MLRIDHPGMDFISELFSQGIQNYLKGSSLVMAFQVFDVLEQEGCRTLCLDDPGDVEKQGALSFIQKAMFSSERVLF